MVYMQWRAIIIYNIIINNREYSDMRINLINILKENMFILVI